MVWHLSPSTGAADLSHDGSMLAVAEGFRHLVFYSPNTHAVLKEVTVDLPERITALYFLPDGQQMVLVGRHGAVVVASTATGHTTLALQAGGVGDAVATLSPDGRQLAIGVGNQVMLWQLATGSLCRTFVLPKPQGPVSQFDTDNIASVTMSANGTRIAADSNRSVVVWNAENGSLIRQFVRSPTSEDDVTAMGLSGSTGDMPPVLFTPDGTGVISGRGATLTCWELSTGKSRWKRKFADGFDAGVVTTGAFSPDGRVLAVGDGKGQVYLTNGQSGEVLQTLDVVPPPKAAPPGIWRFLQMAACC